MSNKNKEELYLIPAISYLFAGLGLMVGAVPFAVGGAVVGTLGVAICIDSRQKQIEKILIACKVGDEDQHPKLIAKQKNSIGTRYVLLIPTGMSIKDFEKKQQEIQQALRQDVSIQLCNHLAVIQTIEKQLKEEYSLDLDNFNYSGMRFAVGKDRSDQEVMLDLTEQDTHTLVVGATGSGKSVALNVLLTQMVLSQIELSLIDLKAVEFVLYADYKHLKGFAINENEAYKVLLDTLDEMNNRYELLLKCKCKNYKDYNKKYPRHKIKTRILVIDEFQSLIDDKASKKLLFMLLSKARGANIVIILSCQSPRHEIVDGRLRDNVKNYLIFRCETDKASEVATATQGDYRATKLRGNGHGLLKAQGQYTEFQGYYLSDSEIERYIEPFNAPYKPPKETVSVIRLDKHKEALERKIEVNLDKLNNL